MLQLNPLVSNVPIFRQMSADVSPVVLMNVFEVVEGDQGRTAGDFGG